jgi:hypothetical protein
MRLMSVLFLIMISLERGVVFVDGLVRILEYVYAIWFFSQVSDSFFIFMLLFFCKGVYQLYE